MTAVRLPKERRLRMENNEKDGCGMMILLQIAGLVSWLIVIPYCMGLLPAGLLKKESRTRGTVFLAGYFLLFSLFELIGIPIVIGVTYHSFSWLSGLFAGASLLTAGAGIIVTVKKNGRRGIWYPNGGQQAPGVRSTAQPSAGERNTLQLSAGNRNDVQLSKKKGTEEKLVYGLFFLLLALQLYMAFTRASFDGDDAYYGVQGVIAQQMDTMYRINPYTGRSAPLDVRHALALITIWEAFIGRVSGVHATIVAHSVVPLLLIPMTYLLYYRIGRRLLRSKKEMLPMFMVVLALIQMFGNVSIYTTETFLLTRTWQGKSIAGNLILPAVFWIFLNLCETGIKPAAAPENEAEKEQEEQEEQPREAGWFLLLACVNMAAGVSSSLAVLLSALLTAGLAFLLTLKERKLSLLLKAGLCCIPNAVYILVYLFIGG